mmetsp:Transcript_10627/g.16656  ORF Transcript_10627/g.16656 Transcript_10627/m.16656 type:complete len:106 (-) Transcript_10627:114-431(-)
MTKSGIKTTDKHFWMTLQDFVQSLEGMEVCSRSMTSAESRRRAELLSLFAEDRDALKPGVRRREHLIRAHVEADKMAADLIAEEERKKKRSPKSKKKTANGTKHK